MKTRHALRPLTALILLGGPSFASISAAEESLPAMSGKATITQERAAEIALARVPGGNIIEAELEKEHGRLVWEFEIARPDSKDVSEVQVDANTGEFVSQETESHDQDADAEE